MTVIVFMFLYYFITSDSYIRCSTVQYSTNRTVISATLINATGEGPKATMERRCVIPESELKDLLQSECFVDKSLIIKDFMNLESRFASVTAPRRFGKTVNLKILKAFLKAENDGHTTSNLTDSCRLFIKYNLNIFTWNNTFFHLHCGKYPVIYINFKKMKGNNFNGILGAFREIMRDSYLEHLYLQNSTRLNVREKYIISRSIRFYSEGNIFNVEEWKLIDGVVHLSNMLYYHFNNKVTVLIDDFDALVWLLLSRDHQRNYDVSKSIFFFHQFMFKLLETNRYVERGLINNCLQFSNIFLKSVPSIVHFRFLEKHPLVKYYGLTENEVRGKLNYYNILQNHEDVKHYYNGYKVQGSGDNIYNTWSVMNYLQTEHLDDYWIATAGLHKFSGIFLMKEVQRFLPQLLMWENITIEIKKIVEQNYIMSILYNVLTTNEECISFGAEVFLLLLSDYGYFNPTRTNINLISLNIPNNEIYQHLRKQYGANLTL